MIPKPDSLVPASNQLQYTSQHKKKLDKAICKKFWHKSTSSLCMCHVFDHQTTKILYIFLFSDADRNGTITWPPRFLPRNYLFVSSQYQVCSPPKTYHPPQNKKLGESSWARHVATLTKHRTVSSFCRNCPGAAGAKKQQSVGDQSGLQQ